MRAQNGIANRVAEIFNRRCVWRLRWDSARCFVPLAHAAISGLSAGVATNYMVVDGGVQWGIIRGHGRLGGQRIRRNKLFRRQRRRLAVAVADSTPVLWWPGRQVLGRPERRRFRRSCIGPRNSFWIPIFQTSPRRTFQPACRFSVTAIAIGLPPFNAPSSAAPPSVGVGNLRTPGPGQCLSASPCAGRCLSPLTT